MRVFSQRAIFTGRNHADDFKRLKSISVSNREVSSYRVVSWPKLFGHRLIDDNDWWRIFAVGRREFSPLQQRGSHRRKEPRSDVERLKIHAFLARRRLTPFNVVSDAKI